MTDEIRETWKARRDELTRRMQVIQREVIADLGGLDLREYRRRLQETGLMVEWEKLQQEPGAGPDICKVER